MSVCTESGGISVASSVELDPLAVAADLARCARALRRDLDHLRRAESSTAARRSARAFGRDLGPFLRAARTAVPAAGSIASWCRGLPRLRLPLSTGDAGDVVLDGLVLRQPWPVRYRAVAVIRLPATFEQYLRGRSMQAVRTNRTRAIARGYSVVRAASTDEARARVERMLDRHQFEVSVDEVLLRLAAEGTRQIWFVLDAHCTPIGMAAVAVDGGVAQLASLQIACDVDRRSDARYLLSSAIVGDLIEQSRDYLVADSMLVSRPGVVYLQRRLGFEPVRVVVPRRVRLRRMVRGLRGAPAAAPPDPRTVPRAVVQPLAGSSTRS